MLFTNPRVIKKGDEYATHIGYAYEGEKSVCLVVIGSNIHVMQAEEFAQWETVHCVVTPEF